MTSGEKLQDADTATVEFAVERYKYILQQISAVNENVHKFLVLYQTLSTGIIGAALGLFVGYRSWGIDLSAARAGVKGLLVMQTSVAVFVALLLVVGVLSWLDYRREECEITEEFFRAGFRRPPRVKNFYRWYETYVILFVVGSSIFMWILAETLILPKMI